MTKPTVLAALSALLLAVPGATWGADSPALGDLSTVGTVEFATDGQVIVGAHRLPLPRHNPILQEMVELPHEERHIETPVERETMLIG